jgi:hypothetical protein
VLVAAFRRNELSLWVCLQADLVFQTKVRERRETFASTPEACAPRKHPSTAYEYGDLQDLAGRQ